MGEVQVSVHVSISDCLIRLRTRRIRGECECRIQAECNAHAADMYRCTASSYPISARRGHDEIDIMVYGICTYSSSIRLSGQLLLEQARSPRLRLSCGGSI